MSLTHNASRSRRKRTLEAALLLALVACLMVLLRPIYVEQARQRAERQARAEAMLATATTTASKISRVGPIAIGVAYSATVGDLPTTARQLARLDIERLNGQLASDPSDYGLLMERARCYRRAGEIENELVDLTTLVELQPEQDDLRLDRARALTRLGRFEQAHPEVARVLQGDPENGLASYLLAEIEVGLGHYQKALDRYREIASWVGDEGDVEVLWGRAAALRGLGQEQEAQALFQRAREIVPGYCWHWSKADDPGRHEGPCQDPLLQSLR